MRLPALAALVILLSSCTAVRKGDATIVTVGGKGRALAGPDISLDFDNEKSFADGTEAARRMWNAWTQLQAALATLDAATRQLGSNNARETRLAEIDAQKANAAQVNQIGLTEANNAARLAP